MDDQIFGETEEILAKIKKPRNRYINEQSTTTTNYSNANSSKKYLEKESYLVKEDSMTVLKEFESLDYED